MAKRKQYSPELKARFALAGIRDDGTIAEWAQQFGVPPNRITPWKREALDGMKDPFIRKGKRRSEPEADIKTLPANAGELIVERDFAARAFEQ